MSENGYRNEMIEHVKEFLSNIKAPIQTICYHGSFFLYYQAIYHWGRERSVIQHWTKFTNTFIPRRVTSVSTSAST